MVYVFLCFGVQIILQTFGFDMWHTVYAALALLVHHLSHSASHPLYQSVENDLREVKFSSKLHLIDVIMKISCFQEMVVPVLMDL